MVRWRNRPEIKHRSGLNPINFRQFDQSLINLQGLSNAGVDRVGEISIIPTVAMTAVFNGGLAEWLNAAVLKTADG